ncbi:MAG: hypothetical protein ACQUYJ_21355, partial [Ferruginibacter sp.]
NGKINITTTTQNTDTAYYFVKGISMYQPVYVTVVAENSGEKVDIRLCKNNWKAPNKTGTTDAKGNWNAKFKTEGSFGIMMITKSREPYQIFTWVGKTIRGKDIAAPFKKQEPKAAKKTEKKPKAKSKKQ